MSIFNAAARRSVGLESRKEDTSIIYNSDPGTFFIENQYRGFNYYCKLEEHVDSKLFHNYLYPDIFFYTNSIILKSKLISSAKYALLKDRNGEKKFVKKNSFNDYNIYSFCHEYGDDGDYKKAGLLGHKYTGTDISGHKYTLDEIEQDCHAFIDNIYEIEKEYEYEQSQN